MNHIFRSIWNVSTGTFEAAPETAKSAGKGSTPGRDGIVGDDAGCGASHGRQRGGGRDPAHKRFALRTVAISVMLAFNSSFATQAWANPTGGQVAAGSASIAGGAGSMTITQTSQNAVLNWQSFSIGASEAVRFIQPNSAAVALNRVLGNDPSSILGSLSANGKVFLVNPNGILFGYGASVNVGGLVASTLDINNSDFMAGRYQFAGASTASVVNQSTITAADSGYVALLGANVSNDGVIVAKLGSVILAGGKAMTLDVAGDGLLNLTIDQGAFKALVNNGGLIQADGGNVVLSAQSAGNLLQTVVNNSGIIQAQTIDTKGGVIRLLGDMQSGTVNVGGTLDASAPANKSPALNSAGGNGGFIETSAAHVKVADDARVTTKAANGQTGSWLIDPSDFTIAAGRTGTVTAGTPSGDISGATLSTALGSTSVTILSSSGSNAAGAGDIHVNDNVSWAANTLTLTAARDININAVMTASGSSALTMNTATANGADARVAGGAVKVGMNGGGFTGRVDFDRSGTGFLTINSTGYTVINSLGLPGSTSGTDLQGIKGALGGAFALGANIDASATSGWNGGAGFSPIGDDATRFTGRFDGLGHTITNLAINRPSTAYVGLFGRVGSTGTVANVGLTDGSVTGSGATAPVA